jgi:hypothetical protein
MWRGRFDISDVRAASRIGLASDASSAASLGYKAASDGMDGTRLEESASQDGEDDVLQILSLEEVRKPHFSFGL